jgi:hypothetical protein
VTTVVERRCGRAHGVLAACSGCSGCGRPVLPACLFRARACGWHGYRRSQAWLPLAAASPPVGHVRRDRLCVPVNDPRRRRRRVAVDPSRGIVLCCWRRVLTACSPRCCCVPPAAGPHVAFVDCFGVSNVRRALISTFLQLAVGFASAHVRPYVRLCGVIVTHFGTQLLIFMVWSSAAARSARGDAVTT